MPSSLLPLLRRSGTTSLALALAVSAGLSAAHASETDALLEALVKKGVLNEKEAAKIQQEAAVTDQQSSASKLKLTNSVTELRLYGDVRLRYQHDNTDYQVDPLSPIGMSSRSPSGNQRDRFRLRLRLDADFKLTDNWFGGVELQTGYGSDTANQTLENGFSDYAIFISRAYLGYSPTEWLTITGGKVPNPFYTTELVWDNDINPSGFTESIALHKLFGHGDDEDTTTDKDGKAVVGKKKEPAFQLSLVAGQFIFDDNTEGGGRDPGGRDKDNNSDAWLFETQLVGSYRFSPSLKATFAPSWMVYTSGSVGVPTALTSSFGDFNTVSFSDSALVSGATRNLNILNAPGDVTLKIANVPVKVYWDVAYNIDGRSRSIETYRLTEPVLGGAPGATRSLHKTRDDFAWLAGLQLGENKKKGDLSLLANYREVGISAVDPNLNDNEFGLGFLNMRGIRVALSYNLTESAVFSINYYSAWSLDKNLVGGEATGDNAIANANATQNLQIDLNVKF